MTTPKTLKRYLMPLMSLLLFFLTQNPNMLLRTALFPPHLHRGARYDRVSSPLASPRSLFPPLHKGKEAPCPFILEQLPTLLLRYTQNLRVSCSGLSQFRTEFPFTQIKAQLSVFSLRKLLAPTDQFGFYF